MEPEVHRSLLALRRYDAATLGTLGLDFTVETRDLGSVESAELVPGGAGVPVHEGNRLMYVHALARWHMVVRLRPAAAAFGAGLTQVRDWRSAWGCQEGCGDAVGWAR